MSVFTRSSPCRPPTSYTCTMSIPASSPPTTSCSFKLIGNSSGGAAIHRQRRPRHERSFVRQQEQRGVGDLLGAPGAAHRHLLAAAHDQLLLVDRAGVAGRLLLIRAGDKDA